MNNPEYNYNQNNFVQNPMPPQPPKKKKKRVWPVVIAVILVAAIFIGCCLGGLILGIGGFVIPEIFKPASQKLPAVELPNTSFDTSFYISKVPDVEDFYNSYWEDDEVVEYNVGDKVLFGEYEQDNNIFNGNEAIQWTVVEVSGDKCVLVSDYVLDNVNFHDTYTAIDWYDSDIKYWLNNDFKYSAFSSSEIEMIEATEWGDVYLLSAKEARTYFESESDRCAKATDYAIDNGVYVDDEGDARWWLRTSASFADRAAYVMVTGEVNFNEGHEVNHGRIGVRPVICINLAK